MLKKLLKISGDRRQSTEDRRQTKRLLFAFCLFSALCILSSVSCAPKHVVMPSYEGVSLEKILIELKDISAIEAILSIEYEKNDDAMSGDALLTLSENSLNLRLYYLGFLAWEVKENKGIIKSNPSLDKNKSILLIDGIRNSFFWWNIKDYTLQEQENSYELENSYRKIIMNKKTLLPVEQTIELNSGEKLNITYGDPVKLNSEGTKDKQDAANSSLDLWYPSRLKIDFKNHSMKIKVKSYSVLR
ncbi:MAG: hypothetical protein QMD01_08945 [Thermodesulfovibrionales bacterium]|nr:hypothetical protein [Thermodesulfovibrionales bacterium]